MKKFESLIYVSTAELPSKTAHSVHIVKMSDCFLEYFKNVTVIGIKNKKNIDLIYDQYNVSKKLNFKLVNIFFKKFISLQIAFQTLFLNSKSIYYTRNIIVGFFLSFSKKSFIYEIHDFYPSFFRNFFEPYVVKSSYLIKIVVISEALKKDFLNKYTFFENIEVHHDGSSDNFKKKNDNEISKFNIGYVGSLYQGRGIELIIKISLKLKNYNFLILGGSKKEISFYTTKYNCGDNLKFCGFVSQKKLKNYYSKMSILLMPYQSKLKTSNNGINTSRWMSPLKLFEYMSTEIPIISSDLPAIREVVDENYVSLVPPNKALYWIDEINKIKANYSKYKKRSVKLRVKYLKHHTWKSRAKNIINNYCK
jgi:glycosyltransferase involved in cell wall biosynthesis